MLGSYRRHNTNFYDADLTRFGFLSVLVGTLLHNGVIIICQRLRADQSQYSRCWLFFLIAGFSPLIQDLAMASHCHPVVTMGKCRCPCCQAWRRSCLKTRDEKEMLSKDYIPGEDLRQFNGKFGLLQSPKNSSMVSLD